MDVNAYAVEKPGGTLSPFMFKTDDVGENEVLIKIISCGICHSDIHLIDNEWGITQFPFVPGHEIIGNIVETGSNVKEFKLNDRVGLGWQCSQCGTCRACEKGIENCCVNMESGNATCVGRHGGFAQYIKVPSDFVFQIPENLDSYGAAPLLCGGATVYNPFKLYGVKPSMKVGVIGIGGLGHLAIKFATAMGCEVYAFSKSLDKKKQIEDMGAQHFITDIYTQSITGTLDFIISTVPAKLDWQRYVDILAPQGTLAFVGNGGNVSIDAISLIMQEKKIGGGSIASKETIKEMLSFASQNNIVADYELFPISKVNEAIERVRENKVRFRAVLDLVE